MTFYTAHYRNRTGEPDLILVKEGFSWPAFVFGIVWALWNRLWIVAGVFLVAELALGFGLKLIGMGAEVQALASVGLALVIGFVANDLRSWSLSRWSGFKAEGVVAAGGLQEAERRFLAERPDLMVEFG